MSATGMSASRTRSSATSSGAQLPTDDGSAGRPRNGPKGLEHTEDGGAQEHRDLQRGCDDQQPLGGAWAVPLLGCVEGGLQGERPITAAPTMIVATRSTRLLTTHQ